MIRTTLSTYTGWMVLIRYISYYDITRISVFCLIVQGTSLDEIFNIELQAYNIRQSKSIRDSR